MRNTRIVVAIIAVVGLALIVLPSGAAAATNGDWCGTPLTDYNNNYFNCVDEVYQVDANLYEVQGGVDIDIQLAIGSQLGCVYPAGDWVASINSNREFTASDDGVGTISGNISSDGNTITGHYEVPPYPQGPQDNSACGTWFRSGDYTISCTATCDPLPIKKPPFELHVKRPSIHTSPFGEREVFSRVWTSADPDYLFAKIKGYLQEKVHGHWKTQDRQTKTVNEIMGSTTSIRLHWPDKCRSDRSTKWRAVGKAYSRFYDNEPYKFLRKITKTRTLNCRA